MGGKGGGGGGPSAAEIAAQKAEEKRLWDEEQAYKTAESDIVKYESEIPTFRADQARIDELMNRKGLSDTMFIGRDAEGNSVGAKQATAPDFSPTTKRSTFDKTVNDYSSAGKGATNMFNTEKKAFEKQATLDYAKGLKSEYESIQKAKKGEPLVKGATSATAKVDGAGSGTPMETTTVGSGLGGEATDTGLSNTLGTTATFTKRKK